MSSLINLGSFNAKNGKSAGLGFASGLDSNALIDSILKARTDAVTAIQDNITTNGKKITAISQLSTLLDTLKTTADFLRGQTSPGSQDSDFFKHTTSSVTSSTSTEASNYISVTSQSGATINSYKITDVVTANAQTLRKDGFTSASTSVVGGALTFQAGTFTLRGSSITLVDGDTLTTIKAKVNAVSNTSGVKADIVKVSDNSYSLVLKSTATGDTNKITEYNNASDSDPLTGTLQFGAASVNFTEQQTANDASFKLDGVPITRSGNAVSDVISGVTFTLLGDTGVEDPTLTVNVGHDTSILKTGINNFITAYNNLKQFISQQNQVDANGNLVDTAVLGNDSILRNVSTAIDAQFNSLIPGIATGGYKSLADIGITTTSFPGDSTTPKTDGIFVLDEAKFDATLAANFDAFRKVFASSFVASSADIGLYRSSNKATLTNYTLDIDTSREAGNKVRVLDATTGEFLFNADYSKGLITGQAGTALDGEQLVYTGDGSDTINITSTKGIADRSYNVLSAFLTAETGLVATTTNAITEQDKTLQDNIDKENADIATERQILVDKFTQLEAIISSANSTLSFLDAQRNSDNSKG